MRNSPYSDDELLKIAAGFKKHLKDHLATFKSVYPGLDQNFIFRFKALYYEVHTQPSDYESESVKQTFKLELEALADQVRSLFPIFRFYLQKAFPYDSSIWQRFGYCELEKVVHDYSSLRECLDVSVRLIQDKRLELKSANCPDSALEEVVRLAKRVSDTDDELQEYFKKKTHRKEVYQNNMNELFKLMRMIHEAASKCLQKDPDSLKYLTFPQIEHA